MTPHIDISLKPTQKLVMTAALRQALKILQVPRLELQGLINLELEENPLLEENEPSPEEEELSIEDNRGADEDFSQEEHNQDFEDINLDAFFGDPVDGDGHGQQPVLEDGLVPQIENTLVYEGDLRDHLLWQLHMLHLTPGQRELAEYIIGNLDADGFLVATCEEIQAMGRSSVNSCADRNNGSGTGRGYTREAVVEALEIVRSLDPPGIAFGTVQESLLWQLAIRGEGEHSLARRMVAEMWDDLTHARFGTIAKSFSLPLAHLQPELKKISALSPHPGRQYNNTPTHYVEPDVYILKVDNSYVIQLNDNGLPRLRVCRDYPRMLKALHTQGLENEAQLYIKRKMRSAIGLLRGLNLRQCTIYKVAASIVKQQRDFLDNGIDHLRPMVMRNVAEDIKMHESTVSRVVSNKYMNTPRGLFPMKFFFHSGIESEARGDISSKFIKQKIQQFIQEEDWNKPLTDNDLKELLNSEGVQVARRTITKYREYLGIGSSSERKQIFYFRGVTPRADQPHRQMPQLGPASQHKPQAIS